MTKLPEEERTCFARDLLIPHADVLLDATGDAAITRGWHRVASRLFADWAALLRQRPGARLRVGAVDERVGNLATVCDAAAGTPPGRVDMEEVRRIQGEAETASLRTCGCCGGPGILRAVGDGEFATRCQAHAEVATGRAHRGSSILAKEIVGNLLRSHGDWLSGDGPVPELPRGWLGLVTEAFAGLRELSRGRDFRLLGMKPVCGRLEVVIEHAEDLDLPQYLAWRSAVLALGDAAFWTCDVCGVAGRIRHADRGMPAPRCDMHADLRRWPSGQKAAPTPVGDPLGLITSARPQWSASGFRTAAKSLPAPVAANPGTAPYAEPSSSNAFPLYELRDVSTALGLADDDGTEDPLYVGSSPPDNEQQGRIRRILERGDAGRWRRLAHPDLGMINRLDGLAARAPHLVDLASLVRRHLLAALHMGLPITLPPLLVVGPPGVGKTWFLTGLAKVLEVPFRAHPLTGASHSDGITGSHGVWRNSQIGLVAKALLGEAVANPLIFVDEFDKIPPSTGVDDLHRPFYVLLEPIGAKRFTDAYLGFPMNASGILWVMASNCIEAIPSPILNRLTIVEAATPDGIHLAAIAHSIFTECNNRCMAFFPPEPSPILVERLIGMTPRMMRLALEDAMTVAAAAGRREVHPDDLRMSEPRTRRRIGFV